MNFKSNLRVGKNNIYIGFRRQTCEKLQYLNIYLRFSLENLFCINTSFSPVTWKGIIDPQSSQNEILGYSRWTFVFVYSFMFSSRSQRLFPFDSFVEKIIQAFKQDIKKMSCIIHEQEIRMLDPGEFHYIYVLTARTKSFRASSRV